MIGIDVTFPLKFQPEHAGWGGRIPLYRLEKQQIFRDAATPTQA